MLHSIFCRVRTSWESSLEVWSAFVEPKCDPFAFVFQFHESLNSSFFFFFFLLSLVSWAGANCFYAQKTWFPPRAKASSIVVCQVPRPDLSPSFFLNIAQHLLKVVGVDKSQATIPQSPLSCGHHEQNPGLSPQQHRKEQTEGHDAWQRRCILS